MEKRILFLILFCLSSFLSCKKESKLSQPVGNSKITFTVFGLQPNKVVNIGPKLSTDKQHIRSSQPIAYTRIISAGDLEYEVILQAETEHSVLEKRASIGKARKKGEAKPMQQGFKYNIVLYETDQEGKATTFFAQAMGEIGKPLEIGTFRNKRYKWFAYSFNNNTDLPAFNASDPQIAVHSTNSTTGNDFLYATGYIQTAPDLQAENNIAITFERKTANVRLSLNTRGIFSAIKGASLAIASDDAGLSDGAFSLLEDKFVNITPAPLINNHEWRSQVADTIPNDWVKYADFATVTPNRPIKLKVSLRDLVIISQQIDGSTPYQIFEIDRLMPNTAFELPEFVPETGKQYRLDIRLRESPILINQVQWARANLFYMATSKGNAYRFRYDNTYFRNQAGGIQHIKNSDYWHGGLKPGDPPFTNADPCQEVYPKGLWRLPGYMDYLLLIASADNPNERVNQPGNDGWFVKWSNTDVSGSHHYPTPDLLFTALGYRDSNQVIQGFNYEAGNTNIGLNVKYGDEGYYRTNDPTMYFTMKYRSSIIDPFLLIALNEFTDSRGASIRCVRK